MKAIEKFEEIIKGEGNRTLREEGVNATLYWAYRKAKEQTGNELLDFDGTIWTHEIPEIAKALKEEGIKEFTISSGYSGLIDTLAAFEEYGFFVNGVTKVNSTLKYYETGCHLKTPAIKMIAR